MLHVVGDARVTFCCFGTTSRYTRGIAQAVAIQERGGHSRPEAGKVTEKGGGCTEAYMDSYLDVPYRPYIAIR